MTEFTNDIDFDNLSLSGLSDTSIVPRLAQIVDPFLVEGEAEVFIQKSHETTPVTYVVNGRITTLDAYYTPRDLPITFRATGPLDGPNPSQEVRLPPHRTVVEYHWDFGDGGEGWGNPVQHTYTQIHPYTQAVLRVTDSEGERHYTRKQMYIKLPTSTALMTSLTLTTRPTLVPNG